MPSSELMDATLQSSNDPVPLSRLRPRPPAQPLANLTSLKSTRRPKAPPKPMPPPREAILALVPGDVEEPNEDHASTESILSVLNFTSTTVSDAFGVVRRYLVRPRRIPDDGDHILLPDSKDDPAEVPGTDLPPHLRGRSLFNIISPFPNWSSFIMGRLWWMGGPEKSEAEFKKLRELLCSEEFDQTELIGVNFEKIM